jgi:RNA polymerase sigma-70 factor (ECF subfamily)
VDCLRRRKAWAPVPREGEDPVDPADLPDPAQRSPSEVVAGAETESLVNAALTQLSDEHRTTLLLRFADGLSYSEIAAATAVSIGTVMSRLFNGRRKLVKLLSQESGVRGQESV